MSYSSLSDNFTTIMFIILFFKLFLICDFNRQLSHEMCLILRIDEKELPRISLPKASLIPNVCGQQFLTSRLPGN